MILVIANIFMYADGEEHPHKQPSLAFLGRIARGDLEAAVDAETLQEILHCYRAIQRWAAGQRVYDLARRLLPVVFPITDEVVDEARTLLGHDDRLMARDALHAVVARRYCGGTICSYDRDFDRLDWIHRVEPSSSL